MRIVAWSSLLLLFIACAVEPEVDSSAPRATAGGRARSWEAASSRLRGLDTEVQETALLPESDHAAPFERAPLILADGSTVISRPGDEPGETELWYTPSATNETPRVIFPGPGADDRPTLLPDGRILFVSTRTTIASLWVGDIATGELVQLTNRGLSAGKPREGFTPPPHGELAIKVDGSIEYDAGAGHRVRLMIGSAQ